MSREVLDALRSSDLPLFETAIPRRVAAEDHVGDRLVGGDEGTNSDLAAAYGAFTQEVLDRTEVNRG